MSRQSPLRSQPVILEPLYTVIGDESSYFFLGLYHGFSNKKAPMFRGLIAQML